MNNSLAENMAVEAAQSIAADKPQTCAINSRKSRRTPKLSVDHDDRGYRHSDLVLFNGDHEAALLYAQIRYWSGTGRNGKPRASIEIKAKGRGWIAKSAEMLWDELMLTEDQVRRINGVFKAGNAVEVETAMYKRSKCTHYRYVSPHAQGVTLPENPESHSGKKPNHTPGKPHVFTESMAETISETKNIQNPVAANATGKPSTETTGKQSGKVKTPKTEQASEPFLKICLSRKLEFLAIGLNTDNPKGCVVPELTTNDLNAAQRLEYELTKAGIEPLAFMDWLTLFRFQRFTLAMDQSVDWSLLAIMTCRGALFDAYRDHLDAPKIEQAKIAAKFEQWAAEDAAAKAAAKNPSSIVQQTAQQASAPAAESVVLHVLTADDYEPCDEPPDDYVKATPTKKELLAAVAAQQAAKQAAKNKATMFQPKPAKASATA